MSKTREQILEQRRQLGAVYGELFDSTAALFRYDPAGIHFEVNPDEYLSEAGSILPRLIDPVSELSVHEKACSTIGISTIAEKAWRVGFGLLRLIVENNIQKRAVDLQPAIVVDESQFPESVHEEADPRAGCADHFRQHLLTDLGNYTLGFAFLAKMCKQ
jgi:hypothetical protein